MILDWLTPAPLFLGILTRIFDILTTRLCLIYISNAYEGMYLGNNITISLGFLILPMLGIQLYCHSNDINHIGKAGSWLLVMVSVIPIINNLIILSAG